MATKKVTKTNRPRTRSVSRRVRSSKKVAEKNPTIHSMKTPESKLRDQYGIIREDILKLKKDLQIGYVLARNVVESNQLWTGIFGPK